MMTAEENDLLCRVEGDAPMGKMMRRYWMPACLSEEVEEPDGPPLRVRLLGEDLVVFRDTSGRLGVLDEHCPHRRASLSYGRNEENGLRCLYHGWKLDIEGNVVEMPSEPAESGFCAKVKHRAYPCQEAGGFVWVWMGDCDKAATFERPAFAPTDSTQVSVVKFVVPCNWAQILEGAIDSAHSSTLHSSDMRPARVGGAKATDKNWLRPSTDKAPKLHVQRTPFGFRYAAIRRPIFNAATHQYVRTTLFVAPITVLIPPNDVYNVANINVPIDDTHTMFHFIAWNESGEGHDTETWRKFCGAQPGIDLDENWEPRRTLANHHLQDRQAMKLGDFTGIRGIPMQDMAMWASMGPITDRTRDRLGASDLAIVEFRRIMVDAARRFVADGTALGAEAHNADAALCAFEGVIPKSDDWRTLGRIAGTATR
ncbi:MAG: Rieske 2Fe-2S domain-containing protein [Betaproteobacteria bacterium]|nr:MAG: Rieske 2Fe-2S domain-containing protein [Betaproteobacteria bacterium]